VPDPFAADPGARLYRTGDRGRWRADGTLEFPLTPSGALDRHALPSPDEAADGGASDGAPVGEIETTVAADWAEVLQQDHVGWNDNFFALMDTGTTIATEQPQELQRTIDWKDAFWVASGVPALVLFSIGGIAGNVGNPSFAVWAVSMMLGFVQSFNEGLTWHAPGGDWTRSIVFGILIAVLVFRPEGILGEQTPEGA